MKKPPRRTRQSAAPRRSRPERQTAPPERRTTASPPRPSPKPAPPQTPKPAPHPSGERLQKLLSRAGVTSRRKAEELIEAGRVRLNGQVVKELGTRANAKTDRISVDGKPLRLPEVHTYLLLHKPVGVVTTLSDPEGRPTVREFLGRRRTRVYPVGRLDFHSSGLLLLTDDGDLAERLMHPRYQVEREYLAKVKGEPAAEVLQRLRDGVRIERGRPARADVRIVRQQDGKAWLSLVLREGRHHEVRRMCLAVGLSVEKLRRVRYGSLELGRLAPGAVRELTAREVDKVRRSVGL